MACKLSSIVLCAKVDFLKKKIVDSDRNWVFNTYYDDAEDVYAELKRVLKEKYHDEVDEEFTDCGAYHDDMGGGCGGNCLQKWLVFSNRKTGDEIYIQMDDFLKLRD